MNLTAADASLVRGDPRKIELQRVMTCLVLIWAILLASSLLQDIYLQPQARIWLLDVDAERSVYTWFSQLLLAGAGACIFLTGRRLAEAGRPLALHWQALSVLFLLLSMDESLSLHERASALVRGSINTFDYLYFAWVIPAAGFCFLGLILARPFILSFPPKARALLIASAAVFLAGALGMEMVGSKIFYETESQYVLAYRLSTNVEEGLEGLGVLMLLYAVALFRRDRLNPPPTGRVVG